MNPDADLLSEALGRQPNTWQPVTSGGYTQSKAWRVETPDGIYFVKQAEDEGSLHMLRREAVVYEGVRGTFLPSFIGFADSGERALLAIEFLANARWPPPYPADIGPLFDAIESVRTAEPPSDLPAQRPRFSRWERVVADPEPLLGLGLCSREWLESSVERLIEAEAGADFTGDALVHNDVYSGNVAFTSRSAVLVDWGAAVHGSPWIDLAFALLSVRAEGGQPPQIDFPGEAFYAAALAGHFAIEGPKPLPEWAGPGSTLREDMVGDLAHALTWASDLLGLPPVRSLGRRRAPPGGACRRAP